MTFALGPSSLKRLEGVAPALVAVVMRAIELSTVDFTVVEGVRSREAMCVNYGKGRTEQQCAAKGVPASYARPELAKVTWLADPFKSKHGAGRAVDLAPWVNRSIAWNDREKFAAIAEAMNAAAAELHTEIIWGGDWTSSPDLPHFEIP